MLNHIEIYKEASRFREAIEKCDKRLLPITLKNFPKGSCGEATLLLAKYLSDKGYGEFNYILGMRDGKSHAWLEQNILIIDITATQFDDQNQEVIVTCISKWHKDFNGIYQHIADISSYDERTVNDLSCAYKNLLKYL